MKLRFLAVGAIVALTACGGGGGGGIGTTPAAPSAPNAPVGPQSSTTANVTLRIPLPATTSSHSKKTPQYISSGTNFLTILVNSVDTGSGPAAPPSWVTTSSTIGLSNGTNCSVTLSVETCSVSVPAPVGVVNYTFIAKYYSYAVSAVTTNLTILQGQANTLSATMLGVVYAVSVGGPSLTPHATLGSYPITLYPDAVDATAEQINGSANYADPYTLTDPDTSGATSLSVNGGPPLATVTINNPSDTLVLNYNGQAIPTFSLVVGGADTLNGNTVVCNDVHVCDVNSNAPADVVLSGSQVALDSGSNGGLATDPNWGQQTIYFSSLGEAYQTINASETGFTGDFGGQFTLSFDPVTCGTGPNAVADALSLGPATSFMIQVENAGFCQAKLTESTGSLVHPSNVAGSPTHDGTFWVSATAASFGIN